MTTRTASPALPTLATFLWLGVAIAVGATGRLTQVPSPGPQLLILALSAATVFAGLRVSALREWIARADLRLLVAPHIIRLFAGVVFLYLAAHGALSPLFARNAGVGDIIAALLAIAVIASGVPRSRPHWLAWLLWNVIGVTDFVIVLGTAAVVATTDQAGIAPILRLPLSVIPTFFVPLLIASHVFVFRRLLATPGEAGTA